MFFLFFYLYICIVCHKWLLALMLTLFVDYLYTLNIIFLGDIIHVGTGTFCAYMHIQCVFFLDHTFKIHCFFVAVTGLCADCVEVCRNVGKDCGRLCPCKYFY